MYTRIAGGAAGVAISLVCSFSAQAQNLQIDALFPKDAAGQRTICMPKQTGYAVDKSLIARKISMKLEIPYELRAKANALGKAEPTARYEGDLYMILAGRPFGEGVYTKEEEEAAELIGSAKEDLSGWLTARALVNGEAYRIIGAPSRAVTASDWFREGSPIQVECVKLGAVAAKPGQPPKPIPVKVDRLSEVPERILLRGKEKDLKLPRKAIAKSDFAKVAYTHDELTGGATATIDGVLGYRLWEWPGPDCKERAHQEDPACADWMGYLIPFVKYKAIGETKSTDTNQATFGVQAALTVVNVGTYVHALSYALDGAYLVDYVHASERITTKLIIEPTLRLADGTPITGIPLKISDELLVRPALALVARGDYVEDPGTDAMLKKASSYTALGADAGLTFYPQIGGVLGRTSLEVTYQHRTITGKLPNVNRFTASLNYLPADSDYLSVGIEYVNGRDVDTFKDEERVLTTLGVRY